MGWFLFCTVYNSPVPIQSRGCCDEEREREQRRETLCVIIDFQKSILKYIERRHGRKWVKLGMRLTVLRDDL